MDLPKVAGTATAEKMKKFKGEKKEGSKLDTAADRATKAVAMAIGDKISTQHLPQPNHP